MSGGLHAAVEALITEATGEPALIVSSSGLGGGCINSAQRIEASDGRSFFVKCNASPLPGLFEREAEGLAALAASGAVRVPEVVGVGGGAGCAPFLVLEMIESAPPAPDRFERFGRGFAELHRRSTGERYGFEHDNYLGATPQPNAWRDDWCAFWREHRLGFQLKLAYENGYGAEVGGPGQKLADRLEEWIGQPDEPPTLCHGDLWGGNHITDAQGQAVLIDPAAYYGRREADLSMTTMFGGFHRRFYDAYQEAWPLADGWETRLEIYQLYHHLNHLNLFGGGYLGGCLAILNRYG